MAGRRSADIRRRWELRVLVALPAVWVLFAAVEGYLAIQLTRSALGSPVSLRSPEVDRVLVLTVGIGSVLALACGTALAFAVTRPMRELMWKVQHRLQGDAASMAAGNEIRQLSNAFDNMLLSFDKFVSDTHIIDGMPLGILVIDGENRIVRANVEAQRMARTDAATLHGRDITWFCPPDVAETLRRSLAAVRASGTSSDMALDLFGAEDGRTEPTHTLRLHPTSIVGEVVVVCRDVRQLETLRGHMQRVDQLAALGAHVASLAHEIGGGLMGIQMLIEAIEPRTPAELKLHDKLRDEAERAARLLTEIRSFGQASARERVPTNLTRVVDEILWMVQPRFEAKQLRVEKSLDDRLPPILVDQDRVVQALINVVNNAFEAAPAGGTVRVAVERDGTGTVVRVANTGSFIPPEEREKIFTLFYTTKKGGSGFGLPQARRAMVDHGGTLEVTSAEDAGTEFALRFPDATALAAASRLSSLDGVARLP